MKHHKKMTQLKISSGCKNICNLVYNAKKAIPTRIYNKNIKIRFRNAKDYIRLKSV